MLMMMQLKLDHLLLSPFKLCRLWKHACELFAQDLAEAHKLPVVIGGDMNLELGARVISSKAQNERIQVPLYKLERRDKCIDFSATVCSPGASRHAQITVIRVSTPHLPLPRSKGGSTHGCTPHPR